MKLPVRHVAVLVMLTVTALFLLTGCGAKQTLSALKERFNRDQSTAEQPVEPMPEQFVPSWEETSPPEDMREVVLYFADGYGQSLVAETRLIPKTEGIARATINELLAGPSPDSGLLPTVPYGTMLRDINVKDDGLIIVDFSRELIDNHAGGQLGETLTVYSIVNTLAQFPTVERVRFLVEGQEVSTIAGGIDLRQDIYPDTSLVSSNDFYN
ncbi:MAG TPA: GerMN domain-containing protein [Clostridia bacterium]|nr:GerMN domain-containing protein [Clostridia bacterium]